MRIFLVVLIAVILGGPAACGSRGWLRDNYMGRDILEPDRRPGSVERDAEGNPILRRQIEGNWGE